jgi:hypothetical protein
MFDNRHQFNVALCVTIICDDDEFLQKLKFLRAVFAVVLLRDLGYLRVICILARARHIDNYSFLSITVYQDKDHCIVMVCIKQALHIILNGIARIRVRAPFSAKLKGK